jgi:hypothetical protein
MSLVPYALRPKVVLRALIIKRGVMGGNPILRPLAMLMVGQGVYLRRSALRQGVVLGNPFWRAIGIVLVGQELYKRALTKAPERIAVERIRAGHRVSVTAFQPTLGLSRRARNSALKRLRADAEATVAAKRTS